MDNLKALNRALLASGAPITSMNIVRKHCSSVSGGRLAEAASRRGARVVALIVSDVTGDDPAAIASGPCAPDPSTYRDALDVVQRYRMDLPYAIRNHLERGSDGAIAETPKPGDPVFDRVDEPRRRDGARQPRRGGRVLPRERRHRRRSSATA